MSSNENATMMYVDRSPMHGKYSYKSVCYTLLLANTRAWPGLSVDLSKHQVHGTDNGDGVWQKVVPHHKV